MELILDRIKKIYKSNKIKFLLKVTNLLPFFYLGFIALAKISYYLMHGHSRNVLKF